jgi:alcohol dehydrogenase class IV
MPISNSPDNTSSSNSLTQAISSTYLPPILQVGPGAALTLANVLNRFNCKHCLIVTDQILLSLGHLEKITAALKEQNITAVIFADTVPEPTSSSIIKGIEFFKAGGFDSIVAIGGGSVMDSAKAINVMGTHGGNISDYKVPHDQSQSGVRLIAIPTTAGTGSEATRFTVITDDQSHEKMLCTGIGYVPDAALIDYTLTLTMPPRVTADSGLDALTHAIEAYVSQRANPYSDSQALAALRLIGPNLSRVYHDPDNHHAREAMMLGATLAGIAFSSASVALVHGMSRPIGAFFAVPHGLSNAMLLPSITEYSIPAAQARYAECARAMGLFDKSVGDQQACEALMTELYRLNKDLDVPSLSAFGVDKHRYESLTTEMARQALGSGSPANNPRVPSVEDMVALYLKVWS